MFTHGWHPLFIGYSTTAYFHSNEITINSWTNEARKTRGSMPPRCNVRDVNKVLEKAEFENKDPVYDDRRIIVEEGHLGLTAESRCSTKEHLAPYRLRRWSYSMRDVC